MSRSGYIEDDSDYPSCLYRAAIDSALYGKRGQAFLRELVRALDALPRKELVADELVTTEGAVCALGAVAKARGIDASELDPHDSDEVSRVIGIAPSMAREIVFENDDDFGWFTRGGETPEARFRRMRRWAVRHIVLRDDELEPLAKEGTEDDVPNPS